MIRIGKPGNLTELAKNIIKEYPRFVLQAPESNTDRTLRFISENILFTTLRESFLPLDYVLEVLFEQLQQVNVSNMVINNDINKMRGLALAKLIPAASKTPAKQAEWFSLCAAILKQGVPYDISNTVRFCFFVAGLRGVIEYTDKALWGITIDQLNRHMNDKWSPTAIIPIVTNRLNALDYVLSCMQEDYVISDTVNFECYAVPLVDHLEAPT